MHNLAAIHNITRQ